MRLTHQRLRASEHGPIPRNTRQNQKPKLSSAHRCRDGGGRFHACEFDLPHPGTTPALMVAKPRGGAHRTFRQARDCRSSSPRGLPQAPKAHEHYQASHCTSDLIAYCTSSLHNWRTHISPGQPREAADEMEWIANIYSAKVDRGLLPVNRVASRMRIERVCCSSPAPVATLHLKTRVCSS